MLTGSEDIAIQNCACVCVHVCPCACTRRELCMCIGALCLSVHRWTSEDVDYLALLFFTLFWERSLTDPWSKASGPHDSASSPVLGLQASKWSYPAFYMSAGVSNSDPHAGVASTLTQEALSPTPTSRISRKQNLKSSEFIYFSMLSIGFSLFYSLDFIW